MYGLIDPLPLTNSFRENGSAFSGRLKSLTEWKIKDSKATSTETGWISQANSFPGEFELSPVLYVNAPAMKVLIEATAFNNSQPLLDGILLCKPEMATLSAEVANQDIESLHPEYMRSLKKIMWDISSSMQHSRFQVALPVIYAAKGVPEDRIHQAACEEVDHSRQLAVTGNFDDFLSQKFIQSPLAQKAIPVLEKQGYSLDPRYSPESVENQQMFAVEIGVRLMRPGMFQELGLTQSEAKELALIHNLDLRVHHGPKANAVINQVRSVFDLRHQ